MALVLVSRSAAPPPNSSGWSGSAPGASGTTATAGRSSSPAGSGTSPGASTSGSGGPAASADLTAEPISGSIPPQTSPTATVTFDGLMLDSATDPIGSARTFSFVSDGPGLVLAQIVSTSPMDSTKLCIAVDAAPRVCSTGATPDVALIAVAAHSRWSVTLLSAGASTPIVDVALSWPADHPSVTLDHGRFQGAPNPDSLRTLTATFQPRAAGRLSMTAAWSATTEATLTLTDASGTKPVTVDTVTYSNQSSITPAYSHAATAGRTYAIALFNNGPDKGRMYLAATIEFP